jgi:flavin-dependent dehydrogenase
MDSCEVLIVGGGPAGSSCVWELRRSGIETIILDKRTFPSDKICGGCITPVVLDTQGKSVGEKEINPISRYYGRRSKGYLNTKFTG